MMTPVGGVGWLAKIFINILQIVSYSMLEWNNDGDGDGDDDDVEDDDEDDDDGDDDDDDDDDVDVDVDVDDHGDDDDCDYEVLLFLLSACICSFLQPVCAGIVWYDKKKRQDYWDIHAVSVNDCIQSTC